MPARLRVAAITIVLVYSATACSGCSSSSHPKSTPAPTAAAPAPAFPARQRLDTSSLVVYQVWLNSYAYNPRVGQTSHNAFTNAAAHLSDVAAMGVTTIQLSPFQPFANDTTVGAPYSIKDYYAVNPGYSGVAPGTTDARDRGIAALQEYVQYAHALGLRVLMDCVYHSTAPDNVLMLQHPDFYRRGPFGGIVRNQFGFAELDYTNAALRSYMIDMTRFWALTAGIDGCRADLANAMPLSFWAMLNNEMKRVKPGWLMIGEVPFDLQYAATYSGPGFRPREVYDDVYAFDAIYGVEYMRALRNVVNGKASAKALKTAWSRPDGLRSAAPEGTVFYRGVDNHDQQPRAVELAGGNAGMLAAMAVNFTVGGIPFVFNGQEIGDPARTSVFVQTFIDWTDPAHAANASVFQRLIALRRSQPALAYGITQWCETSQPARAVAYLRVRDGGRVLVVANLSSTRWKGTVSIPSNQPTMTRVVDLLSGTQYGARGRALRLTLSPYSYVIATVER